MIGRSSGSLVGARRKAVAPVGLTLLGAAVAGIAVVTTRVLATYGVTLTIALIVVVAGSIWFAWTKRTSLALALFMLYLGGVDGYLKLSTGSSLVTLVRDVLLYAIVAGVLVRSQVEGRRLAVPPLSGWVLAYVAFVLLQIANPYGGTLAHSLTGLRPHLEFVPLFFLGYLTIQDVTNLRRFIMLLLVLAAANGVVGYAQFKLSPQQFAAWGPGYAEKILGHGAFTGGGRVFVDAATSEVRVRPFGLGSDAGAGGMFGVLALGGVFAFLSLNVPVRYRLLAVVCGAGAVASIVTSEGRAVIVAGVATVLAYGVLTATTQRRVSSVAGIAVAAALGYFIVASITSSAGSDAFRYQGLSASKILQTTSSAQGRPGQIGAIASALSGYPLGAGLGVAGAASAAAGGSELTGKLNAESEFSFLVVETGIPGLLAVVGLIVLVLGVGLARCRRERDPTTRILLAAVICPFAGILVDLYAGPLTVTVPAGPFLWFACGVIAHWLITVPRQRARAVTLQMDG